MEKREDEQHEKESPAVQSTLHQTSKELLSSKVPRIMVVDDEYDIANVVKIGLEHAGHFQVDVFYNGEQAVREFLQHPKDYYDLILTDIKMPVMNGFELAKRLKFINPEIKIAFMTAYDAIDGISFENMQSSVEIVLFVRKPFHIRELVEKLRVLLGSRV